MVENAMLKQILNLSQAFTASASNGTNKLEDPETSSG
jgi:hypothetical protein